MFSSSHPPVLQSHTQERCHAGCKVYESNGFNNVRKCEVTDLGTAAVLAMGGQSEAFSCIVRENVKPHAECKAKCMSLPKDTPSLSLSSSKESYKPSLQSVVAAKPGPVRKAIETVLPFSSSTTHRANIEAFAKDPSKGVTLW